MAPKRKDGNRAKLKHQLQVGDLVLAKIKGYPPWPAKIARPEDHNMMPDSKKYFVEFYGTHEIAFVPPADIQIFNNEIKIKMQTRYKGKSKYYSFGITVALDEICEDFDKLNQNCSDEPEEGANRTATGPLSSASDDFPDHLDQHEKTQPGQHDLLERNGSDKDTHSTDEFHGLGHSKRCRHGTVVADVKSGNHGTEFSVTSTKRRKKAAANSVESSEDRSAQKSVLGNSIQMDEDLASHFDVGEQIGVDICLENTSLRTSQKGSACSGSQPRDSGGKKNQKERKIKQLNSGTSFQKDQNSASHSDFTEDNVARLFRETKSLGISSPFDTSSHSKNPGAADKAVENQDNELEVSANLGEMAMEAFKCMEHGHELAITHPEPNVEVEDSPKVQKGLETDKQMKQVCSEGPARLFGPKMNSRSESEIIAPCASPLELSQNTREPERDIDGGKRSNSLKEFKEHSSKNDIVLKDINMGKYDISSTVDRSSATVKKSQLDNKKHKMTDTEDSWTAKRSKCVNGIDDKTKLSTKADSSYLTAKSKNAIAVIRNKMPTVHAESHLASRTEHAHKSQSTIDQALLPLAKRHIRTSNATSKSIIESAVGTKKKTVTRKDDMPGSGCGMPPVTQASYRRTTFMLDGEEEQITPVQKDASYMLITSNSSLSVSVEKSLSHPESCSTSQSNAIKARPVKLHSKTKEKYSAEERSPVKFENGPSALTSRKFDEGRSGKAMELLASCTQKSEIGRSPFRVSRSAIVSPKTSVDFSNAAHIRQNKFVKPQAKSLAVSCGKNAQVCSPKPSSKAPESIKLSHNQVVEQKNKISSLEKCKTTPKSNMPLPVVSENRCDINFSAEQSLVTDVNKGERSMDPTEDKIASSLSDHKFADSKSMKHLIAVAQAKRRQTQFQYLPNENNIPFSVTSPSILGARSPSPVSVVHTNSSGNSVQKYTDGLHVSFGSPPALPQEASLLNQIESKQQEHQTSPKYQLSVDSLSSGTEAVMSRDAFEGMIETLSRTKESIGRATRLAIDCAKYGIASEVVELLIQKLESEPSLHRRVDLFFLVDSITQCSHNQRGIAGASYVPMVQAALSRLLGAAAPPGTGTRENRRQCLKVLTLWLERKIMPESLLRRYMDDIVVPNDDLPTRFFLRRPSRAERSVEDPLREMEGMLVDEYGSNWTFSFSGFLVSNVLEDEDFPGSLCTDIDNQSPAEVVSDLEATDACMTTSGDRHHHILEDVDGELEMENNSETANDVNGVERNDFLKLESDHSISDTILESASNNHIEFVPPLPPGPPPPLPSDPPPPPPPLPPSPPPSPLPPSLSPSTPLPLLPPLHPQVSLLPPLSDPPPLSFLPLSSNPTSLHLPSSPPTIAYHPSLSQEHRVNANDKHLLQMNGNTGSQGNQLQQMTVSTIIHGHYCARINDEIVPQQNLSFGTTGNTHSMPGLASSRLVKSGHSEIYLTPQASQLTLQFHLGSSSTQQGSYNALPLAQPLPTHPLRSAELPSNHPSYVMPMTQLQVQLPYNSYTLPSHPSGQIHNTAENQWRICSTDNGLDTQHCSWVAGGRKQLISGTPFIQDGFERVNMERTPSNSSGFQLHLHNQTPSGTLISGHSYSHMLSSRPDIPALSCWRP